MARYIDAEHLMQKLSRMIDFCEKHKVSGLNALFQMGDAIMDCPTADVVPNNKKTINDKGENNMENYYIVRTNRAGVFFGKIKERSATEVTMTDVRKLWHWDGACAVEQLAMDGVKRPDNCNFTITVPEMIVADPIQIIACTEKAINSIKAVKEWKR